MSRPKRFELLTPKFVVWCSYTANSKILASIKFGQYSSASMMVSTRSVTAGSAGFGEWWVSMESK